MLRNLSLRYVFPIGLIIAFFLDGSLSYNLMGVLYRSYSMVPYLSLLWLVLTLFFVGDDRLHLELWSVVLGALFDWYYIGILGVFVFIFPLVTYVNKFLYRYFSASFLNDAVIYLIDLFLLQGLAFLANQFIGKITGAASLTGLDFLARDFIPTILLNLVVFAVLYFPIQLFYNDCQQDE